MDVKETQYLRASLLLLEKALHDKQPLTLREIQSYGMIRRKYIRQAIKAHPTIQTIRRKGKKEYHIDFPPYHHLTQFKQRDRSSIIPGGADAGGKRRKKKRG